MRFRLHLRMSTEKQEDSPETQRRLLTDWAESQGHEIAGEYLEEAVSGGTKKERRPVFARMLADAAEKRRDFDAIITLRRDRFGRDPEDRAATLRYLIKHKCPLWTREGPVGFETPTEILIERVSAAIDEHERLRTGERIREHNLARALQGKTPTGKAPLGLRWDKTAKAWSITDRAGDVVTLFQTYLDTGGNAAETARRMNAMGLRGATGRPFTNGTVLQLLACEAYRQRIYYAGRVADAPDIPRIVPVALIEQTDALMARYRPMAARSRACPSAYAGILFCALCGERLHRAGQKQHYYNPGTWYHGWRCPGRARGTCGMRQMAESILDATVGEALARLLSAYVGQTGLAPIPAPERPPPRRRERLTGQRARWAELYADGVIDRQTLDKHLAGIEKELKALEEDAPPARVTAEAARAWLDRLDEGWVNVPDAERRLLFALCGVSIYVHSLPGTRRHIDLDNTLGLPMVRVPCRYRVSKSLKE